MELETIVYVKVIQMTLLTLFDSDIKDVLIKSHIIKRVGYLNLDMFSERR